VHLPFGPSPNSDDGQPRSSRLRHSIWGAQLYPFATGEERQMARWEATDSGGRAYHRPGASESQPQCSTNGLHRILFEGNGFELQVQRPCAAIGLAHSSPVGRRSSRVLRAVLCAAWVAEVLGAVLVPKSVIAHPLNGRESYNVTRPRSRGGTGLRRRAAAEHLRRAPRRPVPASPSPGGKLGPSFGPISLIQW
jgi:hypothetical protein